MKTETELEEQGGVNMARRSFLRYAGAGVATVGVLGALASCSKDHNNPTYGTYDVGSGDVGILNFAYGLEQLEAAFYTQVIATPYSGITPSEKTNLTAIRDHEILHRNFFKAAIPAASIIPALTPDFSSINFSSRASVLAAAKAFEDLGVTAYDGVAYEIVDTDYLLTAGKIVSVEARHAAYISNLISYGSFSASDQVSATTGLNLANSPSTVLATANTFLKTKLTAKAFASVTAQNF